MNEGPCIQRIIAFGFDIYALARRVIEFFVSVAIPMVSVCKREVKRRTCPITLIGYMQTIDFNTLMIPGRSTSTIRCKPGPLTDNDIT
jgi:hypothetical protein